MNNDGLVDQEDDAGKQSEDDEDSVDVAINTNGQNIIDDYESLEITAP